MKKLPFNEFVLKIIAMGTMTLDHVAIFLTMYSNADTSAGPAFDNPMWTVGFIFKIIGRLAFPLYAFMLVEGVRHTKHFGKYIMRLGIFAGSILVIQLLSKLVYDISMFSSPFIDLVLLALVVYLLKRKDKFSWFAILPIAYIIMTFVVSVVEIGTNTNAVWLPEMIRPAYSLFGLLLVLGFFYSHKIAYITLIRKEDRAAYPEVIVKETMPYRTMANVYSAVTLVFVNLLVFASAYIYIGGTTPFMVYNNGYYFSNIQTYSVLAAALLIFYNGKRGYNKTWFKYFSYFYFPAHITIIALVFYVIFR